MPRERWKLTRDDAGRPAVDVWGDRLGQEVEVLAELAKDPRNGLVRIETGVYRGTSPQGCGHGGWISGAC